MPPSSRPPPPPIITSLETSTSPLPTPTAADEDPQKRSARKLRKKRRNDPSSPVAMDLPERLKGGDDTDDEEVLAPARGQPSFLNMNQSIFGLLAAAGSTVDFNDRFEGHSSDDDEDDQDDDNSGAASPRSDKHRNRRSLYDRLDMRLPRLRDNGDTSKTTVLTRESTDKTSRHRRMASGSRKLFASLPRLPKRKSKKEKEAPVKIESPSEEASESSSEVPVSSLSDSKHDRDSSSDNLGSSTNRLAPVMSRMLEAKADVSMRPSFDMERPSGDYSRFGGSGEPASSPLAVRLAEIFGFAEPEEVIEGRRSVSVALETMLTVHRVPLLAAPERPASRLHVHHTEAHLLLRIPSQESRKPLSPPPCRAPS
jgi:sterol 3beta-glucosyltransferase